jgi:hypothetical protein
MPPKGIRIAQLRMQLGSEREPANYDALTKDIHETTGTYVHPCDLRAFEQESPDLPISVLDALHRYSIEKGFPIFDFYRVPGESRLCNISDETNKWNKLALEEAEKARKEGGK